MIFIERSIFMNKIENLKFFLLENLDKFEYDCAFGGNYNSPDFDLNPHDYLKFAKLELDNLDNTNTENNKLHILNCIFHLKRAVDCQFDVFLHQLNLYNIAKEKNLTFNQKLNFIKDTGIIESSSLSRLNQLRNKMEHHYKYPDILEIQVYYDLVNAFVSLIESSLIIFLSAVEVNLYTDDCFIEIKYKFLDIPEINFEVIYKKNRSGDPFSSTVAFSLSELKEFTYYLKILLIIGRSYYLDFTIDKHKLI